MDERTDFISNQPASTEGNPTRQWWRWPFVPIAAVAAGSAAMLATVLLFALVGCSNQEGNDTQPTTHEPDATNATDSPKTTNDPQSSDVSEAKDSSDNKDNNSSDSAKSGDSKDSELEFHGYKCTVDCSGHQAGYDWAEAHDITDPNECGGNSQSFIEGCKAWAEEQDDDSDGK